MGVSERRGQPARERLAIGPQPHGARRRVTNHGLRRIATDLVRRMALDSVLAKAIIGHATDRMREHYSTVGADEAAAVGTRLLALMPRLVN